MPCSSQTYEYNISISQSSYETPIGKFRRYLNTLRFRNFENLSFGAFHGEELVSACLTCDFKTNLIQKGIKPTENAQFIINLIDQLFQEFIQKQEINKKQVVYLNHLGTNKDYLRQNLATACAYLSIAECQNYGYEQVITDSWHQGTFGTYEKMFKLFEVIKEINQLNEQPVHIKSLIAQITPYKPQK